MLDSVIELQEVDPPGNAGYSFPYRFVIPLTAVILVTAIADWLWWQYNIKDLKTVPTSKSNRHITIAFRLLSSVFHNKLADANVLFFQLLQGMVTIHQQQNMGAFYMWMGFRPVVMGFSPDFFETILKSNTNLQKSFDYTFLSLWLKEGLVTSVGNKWRNRRRVITSAFHFRILENFVSVFDKQSRYMVNMLKDAAKGADYVDVMPYLTMCTLDTICETAMGINIHAQDNHDSPYVKRMHKACEAFIARVFRPWLWPSIVFFNSKMGKEFVENTSAMDKFTRQVIVNRKTELVEKLKNGIQETEENKRKAFLDLLLDMHISDPTNFTENDIQEEVDSFMFAGHDTTAVGTGWTLYMLGLYPEIQNRVLEEIDAVYGDDPDKPVTEECIKELRYLELVIKETQRIYPPAPYIGRQLQEDVYVHGYKIPKGTTIMLVIYMLHRDPKVFPNPEVFDPDRFLPENCAKRHPYAYAPFSAGPRSCIGQKFAILEEKAMISNVLRNFRVETIDQRDKLQLAAELVLRSRGGVKLRLIPRR